MLIEVDFVFAHYVKIKLNLIHVIDNVNLFNE